MDLSANLGVSGSAFPFPLPSPPLPSSSLPLGHGLGGPDPPTMTKIHAYGNIVNEDDDNVGVNWMMMNDVSCFLVLDLFRFPEKMGCS